MFTRIQTVHRVRCIANLRPAQDSSVEHLSVFASGKAVEFQRRHAVLGKIGTKVAGPVYRLVMPKAETSPKPIENLDPFKFFTEQAKAQATKSASKALSTEISVKETPDSTYPTPRQILNFTGPLGIRQLDLSKWLLGGIIPTAEPGKYVMTKMALRSFLSEVQQKIDGVQKGFFSRLMLKGVGYRAFVRNGKIIMQLDYNAIIVYNLPSNVWAKCKKNRLLIFSNDKKKLGIVVSEIRALRPPDPYRGKGISLVGETIRLRPGKVR